MARKPHAERFCGSLSKSPRKLIAPDNPVMSACVWARVWARVCVGNGVGTRMGTGVGTRVGTSVGTGVGTRVGTAAGTAGVGTGCAWAPVCVWTREHCKKIEPRNEAQLAT